MFHVPTKSNFVFTREIARIKGSDASNLHDEEVGEEDKSNKATRVANGAIPAPILPDQAAGADPA